MGSNGQNGNRAHLEIVPFEVNDASEGFMVFHGVPPTEIDVERTAENDHLFMYNHTAKRFEVLRYGSALIVSMLRMNEPEDSSYSPGSRTSTHQRQLAVFNTDGDFHNHLVLREPLYPPETDSGIRGVKHTAFFDKIAGQERWSLTMAVDDIYIFSLAKPSAGKK